MDHDEDAARAVLLLALAESASALADAGAETHSGVLDDGNGTKQHAGKEGNHEREEQNRSINADFTDARKPRWSDSGKNAQSGVGETQTDGAAQQSENDTFEQKIGSDASAAGTQGGAHGQFLTAALDADEQQIGDIGAGDQKDHTNRAHENPEHAAHVADDVALQRADVGADVRVFKELEAETWRSGKGSHNNRKHASNVGVDLLEGDAGPESGETVVAEIAEVNLVAVKLERGNHGGIIVIEEMKALRQNANNLAALAIHDDVAADHGGVAAKLATPITVSKHDGFGSARRIILFAEAATEQRRNAEERESAVRDAQGGDLLGFGNTGHTHRVALIQANILQGAVLFAVDEVVGGGQFGVLELDAGCGKPHTY